MKRHGVWWIVASLALLWAGLATIADSASSRARPCARETCGRSRVRRGRNGRPQRPVQATLGPGGNYRQKTELPIRVQLVPFEPNVLLPMVFQLFPRLSNVLLPIRL